MKSTPASASQTNNFSNDGFIIGGSGPRLLAYHPRIATQHFQSLEGRLLGQTSSHAFPKGFLERINHAPS